MKVLATLVLALGAVSALGSGPYLPSGWKPKGPAFLLPTEVKEVAPQPRVLEQTQQTSEEPAKLEPSQPEPANEDLQESEASGSDSLREYGPPNLDLLKTITEQALPALQTEQPFVKTDAAAVEATATNTESEPSIDNDEEVKISEVADKIAEVTPAEAEQITTEDEATTQSAAVETQINNEESDVQVKTAKSDEESQIREAGSLEYLPPSVNKVDDAPEEDLPVKDGNTDSSAQVDNASSLQYPPTAEPKTVDNTENATPLFQAKLETESPENASVNTEYFPPINQDEKADSNEEDSNKIESENDLKTVDDAVVIEAKLDDQPEEGSGLKTVDNAEEPVGFREYGPPKQAETNANQENNGRRRRFSSKFVPVRKH